MTDARKDLAAAFRRALLDKIEWHPVTTQPEERAKISVVTDGQRRSVAQFKDGEWLSERGKRLTFTPTHWMGLKDE